jgi:hypothetical protein
MAASTFLLTPAPARHLGHPRPSPHTVVGAPNPSNRRQPLRLIRPGCKGRDVLQSGHHRGDVHAVLRHGALPDAQGPPLASDAGACRHMPPPPGPPQGRAPGVGELGRSGLGTRRCLGAAPNRIGKRSGCALLSKASTAPVNAAQRPAVGRSPHVGPTEPRASPQPPTSFPATVCKDNHPSDSRPPFSLPQNQHDLPALLCVLNYGGPAVPAVLCGRRLRPLAQPAHDDGGRSGRQEGGYKRGLAGLQHHWRTPEGSGGAPE